MESESQEERSLALETSMLVRLSARTGCEVGDDILNVEIEEKSNDWFGQYGRKKSRSFDSIIGDCNIDQLNY